MKCVYCEFSISSQKFLVTLRTTVNSFWLFQNVKFKVISLLLFVFELFKSFLELLIHILFVLYQYKDNFKSVMQHIGRALVWFYVF